MSDSVNIDFDKVFNDPSLSEEDRLNYFLNLIVYKPDVFIENETAIIEKTKDAKSSMQLLLQKIIETNTAKRFKSFIYEIKKYFITDPFSKILYYWYVLKIFPETQDMVFKSIEEPTAHILQHKGSFFNKNKILGDETEKDFLGIQKKELLVEWLLDNFGLRALNLIRNNYQQENDAIRMKYFKTVERFLGKQSLPILIEDGLLYEFDFSKEYGFMDYEKYVRHLMRLISKYDFTQYYDKIRSHFSNLKDDETDKLIQANSIRKFLEYKMV